MEKLFTRFIVVLLLSSPVLAQDSLCVFDLKGAAYLKIQASLEPLGKGSFVGKQSILMLQETDVTAIDASGRAYQLKGSGEYPYKEILKNKVLEKGGSLTAKYFKLIWDEFLNKENDKIVIGGVFRGEIPMIYPPDSAMVLNRSITFKWEPLWETEMSYFFFRNNDTDEMLKLATNGNSLTLYKENPIFSEGMNYEWVVSGDAFPSLENIPFFKFNGIDRDTYESMEKAFAGLISDLKSLGISEKDIDSKLCDTYGLCR